jgi:glucose-6-phosphate 1-dehydrogenase
LKAEEILRWDRLARDIAQNHLIQLVAAVAMEPPQSFVKESIRDARAAAIQSIRAITPEEIPEFVIRGQYEGYRQEKDIATNSNTETFVALKSFVDTPRFAGVPFYIRAGKKMPKDVLRFRSLSNKPATFSLRSMAVQKPAMC